DWTADIVRLVRPSSIEDVQRLHTIVASPLIDTWVRCAAIEALGHASKHRDTATGILLNLLAADTDDELRIDALRSIATVQQHLTPELYPLICNPMVHIIVSGEETWPVRIEAARTLSTIAPESQEAALAVIDAARSYNYSEYELRELLEIVGQFNTPAALDIDLLYRGLESTSETTRLAAINAIAQLGSAEEFQWSLIDLISQVFETTQNKQAAVAVLQGFGSEPLNLLVEEITNMVARSQIDAIYAIARLESGAVPALPTLLEIVGNTDHPTGVRNAAVFAIGAMGLDGKQAAAELYNLFHQGAPTPALASAIVALANIGQLKLGDISEVSLANNDQAAQ
ncbi:MAG: hypothetical protein KDA51_00210, partial [Planctomycetales bacterium]|nr:hypothetical protein [Planctomycetales bacterium]